MNKTDPSSENELAKSEPEETAEDNKSPPERPKEIGGRKGPDPTRYGDWEKGGRCIDF